MVAEPQCPPPGRVTSTGTQGRRAPGPAHHGPVTGEPEQEPRAGGQCCPSCVGCDVGAKQEVSWQLELLPSSGRGERSSG